MTEAQHTPGPWGWRDDGFSSLDGSAGEQILYYTVDDDGVRCHNEADALLIAAAPDLLATLREAERFMAYFAGETDNSFEGPGTPQSCVAEIRAAIAKASPSNPKEST